MAMMHLRAARSGAQVHLRALRYGGQTLAVVVLAAGVAAAGCTQALKFMKEDPAGALSKQTITAPNPSDRGPHLVKTMFYGSGTDKQRAEFRTGVTIKTKAVDVTPFATVTGDAAKQREKFFGFTLKKAPLNGRVWYPDGPGPWPLVLIVHGNHNYREFSDPGYGYLGELLASRGFIMVSVDENFINGLSAENDGRAWLLLKHLEAWKGFNEAADGPFFGRVDMNNIAVMGHSRGGEAAATAAAFNRLKYYPDDFKQEFKFNFNIKAVVAIAPVDGQYKPSGVFTPLENVNYLIIHGSHDGDVSTASGARQYERLQFTDGQPWFKSMVFMYRANHGQWNTVWQNKDNGPRSGRSLDLRTLIDGEAQRQMGKVFISGFLEATLHQKRDYVPMFRDHRTVGPWLPKTLYTTKFQENGFKSLSSFDRDVDLTTGSVPGVVLAGEHLSAWKEEAVPFRGRGGDNQNHNAVTLGWHNRFPADEKTKDAAVLANIRAVADAKRTKKPVTWTDAKGEPAPPASFTVSVPEGVRSDWGVSDRSAVYLSLAATNTKPGPRARPKDPNKKEEDEEKKPEPKKPAVKAPPKPKEPKRPKEEPDQTPIDLTVELVDTAGHVVRLPLSQFGIARRPLDTHLYRRAGRDTQRFSTIYELIPQTFVMPVADFAATSAEFDPRQLASIRLVFDRTEAGTIVLEHVGLSTPTDAAFLAAPVR